MASERKGNLKYSTNRSHTRRALFIAILFMAPLALHRKILPSITGSSSIYQSNLAFKTHSDILPVRSDWQSNSPPAFCEKLKAFPQPRNIKCQRTKGSTPCNYSSPQFFSQDGEDYFLFTRHFARKSKPGIYLDVAANDAIDISNTYFLDRCLGWRGICAEANPKYFEGLHRERSCHLIPTCISDIDGVKVQFGFRGASGGILDTYKGNKQQLEEGPVNTLKCTTIRSVLNRFNVRHIDYLSLDVEGHELMVLRSIDWEVTTIDVISVELSSKNRNGILEFLDNLGFTPFASGVKSSIVQDPFFMNDPVFIHKRVKFGEPDVILTE